MSPKDSKRKHSDSSSDSDSEDSKKNKNKKLLFKIKKIKMSESGKTNADSWKREFKNSKDIELLEQYRIKPVQFSLLRRVLLSYMPNEARSIVIERIKHLEEDKCKQIEWIEGILKVPWGKYSTIPIKKDSKKEEIEAFFNNVKTTLNESVYGMENIKEEIVNFIAQIVSTNNKSMPRVIALGGPPGIGKTKMLKTGLSPALKRPIKCISMGGSKDSNSFVGFDYSYVGSKYGIILQSLIETGVMNPIIFMDELDKISSGHNGEEIQNLLIHLTDPIQNNCFQDKYYAGIEFDLSRVIFIFSFNDENLISPILRDRLHIIKVPSPTVKEKVIIGQQFLPKEILPNIGFKTGDLIFPEETLRYIISTYCEQDKGIRGLKKILESLCLKVNTARFTEIKKYKTLKDIKFPFTISKEVVDECVKKEENDSRDYVMRHMFI